ncbi:hypothetical protein A2707_04990 [Candidatus Saccharibacteria bacterium RIFCSPHIGHO2_01_FULL_45_15]|nr:MAG: hypothetical protein A2707_04990 [Candidatus Saccharibacteria bacterium RIFCSPHIGHO2_01_FULL_45_15]OGL28606.1 MAG: hypothetical protein A3C39_04750 [Candidatus Saccharibacteria bacterium RIFCSPHIGHO2_02_FULL_46_12]OGL32675.1 MAG: hypothetical protein A3E76_04975 [Candidatus Saccharibacteria bacterium RIFCSPHIGHO2_12_FULL_44_22]
MKHDVVHRTEASFSARDQAILRRLAEHRYLTSRQIERFFFTRHHSPASAARSCRRVLARLYEQHLVTRLSVRAIGGWAAGSTGYTYRLARPGYEALTLRPNNTVTRSPLFLEHTLAIADVRLALEQLARAQRLQLVGVDTEPNNWVYYGSFGVREVLKPDLFVVTATSPESDYEDTWFIELDRATSSLNAVLQKCRQYISYRLSSEARARPGGFPIVVWLVPTRRRQREVQQITQKLPLSQRDIFRVVLRQQFAAYLSAYYSLGQVALQASNHPSIARRRV